MTQGMFWMAVPYFDESKWFVYGHRTVDGRIVASEADVTIAVTPCKVPHEASRHAYEVAAALNRIYGRPALRELD